MNIEGDIEEELKIFLQAVSVRDISRNIRRVVIGYIQTNCKSGMPEFMEDFLTEINLLLDFLDFTGDLKDIERNGE